MDLDQQIVQLVVRAYEGSKAFRERMAGVGLVPTDISGVDDLKKIPVLKKDMLVDLQKKEPPFGGLLTVDSRSLARVFLSPGPIFDPQGDDQDYWRWRETLESVGFGEGDVVLNTFSYHLTPAGFMFDGALRALGAVVVPTGIGNTEQQVMMAKALGATGYVGTPSFLYAVLKKAKEMGYRPGDLSLKTAFVSAEKLPESLRDVFEGEWGIKTRQGYGTADVGAVAFECDSKEGMHISQGIIVEILDPNTGEVLPQGETGEVVVTLIDPLYALIRFGTGDLSQLMGEPCRCGRSSPRISGILGRVGDAVKVRGMFVHGHQIRELIENYSYIKALQCIITREEQRDYLTFRVALAAPVSPEELQKFRDNARDKIKVKVDNLELVDWEELEGKPLFVDLRKWE
jgi:phenylacetate-CoA ligase